MAQASEVACASCGAVKGIAAQDGKGGEAIIGQRRDLDASAGVAVRIGMWRWV